MSDCAGCMSYLEEVLELQAKVADLDRRATDYAAMNDRQSGMIAKLDADARRYRWLRSCNWDVDSLCVVTRPRENVRLGADCPSLDRLDAAIDAAMKES